MSSSNSEDELDDYSRSELRNSLSGYSHGSKTPPKPILKEGSAKKGKQRNIRFNEEMNETHSFERQRNRDSSASFNNSPSPLRHKVSHEEDLKYQEYIAQVKGNTNKDKEVNEYRKAMIRKTQHEREAEIYKSQSSGFEKVLQRKLNREQQKDESYESQEENDEDDEDEEEEDQDEDEISELSEDFAERKQKTRMSPLKDTFKDVEERVAQLEKEVLRNLKKKNDGQPLDLNYKKYVEKLRKSAQKISEDDDEEEDESSGDDDANDKENEISRETGKKGKMSGTFSHKSITKGQPLTPGERNLVKEITTLR